TSLKSKQYFWWASIRLDPHPKQQSSHSALTPCADGRDNCVQFEPMVWVHPGWLEKILVFSALPAFFAGVGIAHSLGKLGISEVSSFMVSMPILILSWFYFLGWMLDRFRAKRFKSQTKTST